MCFLSDSLAVYSCIKASASARDGREEDAVLDMVPNIQTANAAVERLNVATRRSGGGLAVRDCIFRNRLIRDGDSARRSRQTHGEPRATTAVTHRTAILGHDRSAVLLHDTH